MKISTEFYIKVVLQEEKFGVQTLNTYKTYYVNNCKHHIGVGQGGEFEKIKRKL